MRNRIPTYPGRVHLAPVEGQTNVFDMTRADEPSDPGTPLNKGTLLSDDVEALIWGAAADRTVNDAFGKVSELYQHWWSILHGEAYSYWEDVKTPITAAHTMIDGSHTYVEYSKSITFDAGGNVALSNPIELDVTASLSSLTSFCKTLAELAPVYFVATKAGGTKTLYFLPAGATYKAIDGFKVDQSYTIFGLYDSANNGVGVYLGYETPAEIRASTVSSQLITVPAGETTYVHSTDRNAYPDSGTVDGMTYKYLGVPFDNARGGIRMGELEYTGTGSEGSSLTNYANQIVFPDGVIPKIIFIEPKNYTAQLMCAPIIVIPDTKSMFHVNYTGGTYGWAYYQFYTSNGNFRWYLGGSSGTSSSKPTTIMNRASDVYKVRYLY